MWGIYDELIDSIPEDLTVIKCMIVLTWTLVRSEAGVGTAMTMKSREGVGIKNIAGMKLKELAAYAKSWNVTQAAIGQAAINSALNTQRNVKSITGSYVEKTNNPKKLNAFSMLLPEIKGKNVAVIGHFPKIDELYRICNLSILERILQDGDFPDTACEYILPVQDYVFITGTAFINKTMPRLLQLSKNAKTILVGPSVPISPILFKYGVNSIAGMVVVDENMFWKGVQEGAKLNIFRHGGQMICINS